jgi:hypothetical protein
MFAGVRIGSTHIAVSAVKVTFFSTLLVFFFSLCGNKELFLCIFSRGSKEASTTEEA